MPKNWGLLPWVQRLGLWNERLMQTQGGPESPIASKGDGGKWQHNVQLMIHGRSILVHHWLTRLFDAHDE